LLLALVFISFIFGMFIGRYRLLTVLINTYVSFAILSVIPPGFISDYSYELIAFLTLVVGLTLLGKKIFEIHISGAGSGFLWRVFAMSFLEVTLLLSIILSILPKKTALSYVSSSSLDYLASPNARLIWMVAPLIFLFFIHKRLNR